MLKLAFQASMYDPDLATSVRPSLIAATASYIAISLFGERTKSWDTTMVFHSGYLESEIIPVVPRLAAIVRQLCQNSTPMFITKKWASIVSNSVFSKWLNTP